MSDEFSGSYVRTLSEVETFYVGLELVIWIEHRVTGPLDLQLLGSAWSLLRRKHPVLDCRVLPAEAGQALFAGNEPAPLRIRELTEPDWPPAHVLDHRETVSVLEVGVLRNHMSVTFGVSHALADGRVALKLCEELWSLYTSLAEGNCPELGPQATPKAVEQLLDERGVKKVDERCVEELCGPKAHVKPVELPVFEPVDELVYEHVQFSSETTARLKAFAKASGQSVYGLLAGVVAVAIRRGLPVPEAAEVPVELSSPVDLAGLFEPAAQTWETANSIGFVWPVVHVRADSDPVDVGAEALRQLREDIAAGVAEQSVLHMRKVHGKWPKAARTMLSNVGAVSVYPAPPGLKISEPRAIAVRSHAVTQEGIQHGWDLPAGANATHFVITYDGRIAVNALLAFSPEKARAHAETLRSLLEEIANSAPSRGPDMRGRAGTSPRATPRN